jgi:hypothetical protein
LRPSATVQRRRRSFACAVPLTTIAGKSQILPTDAWARSSVTERKLEELVRDGLLRPRASRTQPEWRVASSDHREPAPPEGYVVSFMAFHERGFGVPASPFMRVLLHNYKVELHHLAPNSISQAAIFAAVCEGYLGMEPPLQGRALRQEGGRARGAARSARGELHPPSLVRSR